MLIDYFPYILSLASIASTVVIAVVNNRHSIKQKQLDYEHEMQTKVLDSNRSDMMETFNSLIKHSTLYLTEPENPLEQTNVLLYLYKTYLYADEELAQLLSVMYMHLEEIAQYANQSDSVEANMKSCQETFFKIVEKLGSMQRANEIINKAK